MRGKIEGQRKRGQEEKKEDTQRETGYRILSWGLR
jgi:hypothetical protein